MYIPPSNVAAEQAIIGSILISKGGDSLRLAKRIITPGMFYDEKNCHIFHAMCKHEGYIGIDAITMIDTLRQSDDLGRIGIDQQYLLECMNAVGHADHVEHYCKIVARVFYERKIGDKCLTFKQDPTSHGIDEIKKLVLKREELSREIIAHVSETLHQAVDQLNSNDEKDRFDTGFPILDKFLSSLHAGEVNTWGAATNRGKSVLLSNMALHSAQRDKTIYFGTEMSAIEIVNRMVPIAGGPAAWQIRKGLNSEQMQSYLVAAEKISKYHLSIVDNPEPTLSDIERGIESFGAKVVYIDYLERVNLPKGECLRLRIAEFMRRLKTLARVHKVVIHLAAQLNRSAYGKDEGEAAPTLNQLSESSAVEKESDRVFLLWSPSEMNSMENAGTNLKLILAKNRHGRKGVSTNLCMDNRSLRMVEVN